MAAAELAAGRVMTRMPRPIISSGINGSSGSHIPITADHAGAVKKLLAAAYQ